MLSISSIYNRNPSPPCNNGYEEGGKDKNKPECCYKKTTKKNKKNQFGGKKKIECISFEKKNSIDSNDWKDKILDIMKLLRDGPSNSNDKWCHEWNPFNNKVIIIDEIHNLISSINSGSFFANIIYNLLLNAFDLRLVFLSGTPVRNDLYEFGLIYNLLKGKKDIYAIKNINDDINLIKKNLEDNCYIEKVMIHNKNIYFTKTPYKFKKINEDDINSVDSRIDSKKKVIVNDNNINDDDNELNIRTKFIKNLKNDEKFKKLEIIYKGKVSYFENDIIPGHKLTSRYNSKQYKSELDEKRRIFEKKYSEKQEGIDKFKKIIIGTTSFYNEIWDEDEKLFPSVDINTIDLDMNDLILANYQRLRKEEQEKEQKSKKFNKIKNLNTSTSVTSLFKVYTRQCSIFTFPNRIERPRKNILLYNNNLNEQYSEITNFFIDLKNDNSELDIKSFEIEFKKNFDFSLSNKLIKVLHKEYKTNKSELESNLESNLELLQDELVKKVPYLKQLKTTEKKYNKELTTAIRKLNKNDLTVNLKNYSPKFEKIISLIEITPGLVLVYSSFRNVEGHAIFKKVLDFNGYENYNKNVKKNKKNVKKNDKVRYCPNNNNIWFTYQISKIKDKKATIEICADEKFIKDRFESQGIDFTNEIYDNIKIIKNVLLNKCKYIEWETGDKKALDIFNRVSKDNKKDNRFGQQCLILLITKSGAEGLNLKNVRQVHLMEPYWNNSRRNQVIGRARRIRSHSSLPAAQQNVKVYNYCLKIGEKLKNKIKNEKNSDYTSYKKILNTDKWVTTDEEIMNIANKKEKKINKLLEYVKETAIDCYFNWNINLNTNAFDYLPENKRKNDEVCYNTNDGVHHVLREKYSTIQSNIKLKNKKLVEYNYLTYKFDNYLFLRKKEKKQKFSKKKEKVYDAYFYYFNNLYYRLNEKDKLFLKELIPFIDKQSHPYKIFGSVKNNNNNLEFELHKNYDKYYLFNGNKFKLNGEKQDKKKIIFLYNFINQFINWASTNNKIPDFNWPTENNYVDNFNENIIRSIFNIIKKVFKSFNRSDLLQFNLRDNNS